MSKKNKKVVLKASVDEEMVHTELNGTFSDIQVTTTGMLYEWAKQIAKVTDPLTASIVLQEIVVDISKRLLNGEEESENA